MAADWDPERYLRFRAQRREPFEELVALVRPDSGMRVVDLGCGPGELTVELAERFAATDVLGIDRSEAMLHKAAAHERPGVAFQRGDIATAPLADLDLVFSNAALHWVPNHRKLFARLAAALRPRGQLAVQMPNNFAQPTHTTAIELASEPPFADALGGIRIGAGVLPAESYATMLRELGFAEQVVREPIYVHELPSAEHVLEWVRGSMLTWYEAQLEPQLFAEFVRRYEKRLLQQLGAAQPFLFTYRRVVLWATR